MKKLFFSAQMFAAIGILFIFACKKDLTEIPTETETTLTLTPTLSNVTIKDGRLVFKTKKDFENALGIVFDYQKDLKGFESQFHGFISARQAFKNLTEADFVQSNGDITAYKDFATFIVQEGETFLEPVVDAIMISYLVNQEGLLQIGQEITKFTRDATYTFDESQLENYRQNPERLTSLEKVERKAINRSTADQKPENIQLRWDVAQCDIPYQWDGRVQSRRISGEIANTSVYLYSEIRVQTKNRYRGFLGRWYYKKAKELKHQGGVFSTKIIPLHSITSRPYPVFGSANNEAEIHNVLDWTTLGIFDGTKANTSHIVKPTDQTFQCDIIR